MCNLVRTVDDLHARVIWDNLRVARQEFAAEAAERLIDLSVRIGVQCAAPARRWRRWNCAARYRARRKI